MSYNDYEQSVDDGAPIELFSFTSELYNYYYTTNHSQIVYNTNTYLPLQIARSDINNNAVIVSPETVDFTMPLDSDFGDAYGKPFSPPDLKVRVFRRHRASDDYKKIFVGKTTMFTPKSGGLFVVTTVPLIQSLLDRNMSANRWGNKCNHDLFDNRCKVNKDDFTWTTVIDDITDPRTQFITVADDHNDDGALALGDIIINGERRLIQNNTANVIKIRYPFTEIEIGMEVTLIAGCLKNKAACLRFDNYPLNFGGFPLSPDRNVVKYQEPGFKVINLLPQVP